MNTQIKLTDEQEKKCYELMNSSLKHYLEVNAMVINNRAWTPDVDFLDSYEYDHDGFENQRLLWLGNYVNFENSILRYDAEDYIAEELDLFHGQFDLRCIDGFYDESYNAIYNASYAYQGKEITLQNIDGEMYAFIEDN